MAIKIIFDNEIEFQWISNVIGSGVLNSSSSFKRLIENTNISKKDLNKSVTYIRSDNYINNLYIKQEDDTIRYCIILKENVEAIKKYIKEFYDYKKSNPRYKGIKLVVKNNKKHNKFIRTNREYIIGYIKDIEYSEKNFYTLIIEFDECISEIARFSKKCMTDNLHEWYITPFYSIKTDDNSIEGLKFQLNILNTKEEELNENISS